MTIDYKLFEKVFTNIKGEPEFTIIFNNKDSNYMIIKYADYLTFQRCDYLDGSGEIKYNSLQELYESKTIDDICLKDDWNKISDIVIDDVFSFKNDLETILKLY